jgi:hypothetical protein
MRKASGLAFVCVGAIGFTLYGIVMLRLPLPESALHIFGLGKFGFYVDPVVAPVSAGVALISGILLLRRGSPPGR